MDSDKTLSTSDKTLSSPGLEPPVARRLSLDEADSLRRGIVFLPGPPSSAHLEAEVDKLGRALDLEARMRFSAAESWADARREADAFRAFARSVRDTLSGGNASATAISALLRETTNLFREFPDPAPPPQD